MAKTDWDSYYNSPYKLSTFSRRIVGRTLLSYIQTYCPATAGMTLMELGGGNSCFYHLLTQACRPAAYYVVDNNQVGLDRFRERLGDNEKTVLINGDILAMDLDIACDLVFSVGLIEHFNREDTRKAIASHFSALKEGGILILSFPTPTFLYRATRKMAELLGMWIFHDERPLVRREVMETACQYGEFLEGKIIWPIFLTQAMLVFRKNANPSAKAMRPDNP